jgi:hypothetical protein
MKGDSITANQKIANLMDVEQLQELSEVAGQIDGSHKECGA